MPTIDQAMRPIVLLSLIATLVSLVANADDLSDIVSRPRIGLVLGGGGAKGAGHIGVLRVLDELRIPVDCVAGTSMGALVGATFAAGVPPADIERALLAIDWSETVGGQGQRDQMPIGRKLTGLTYSNSWEFGIGDGRLRSPSGLLATQLIEDQIRTLVASSWFTDSFDDLPIPFRAVATDMLAGRMVVIGDGDLPAAMRSSMAIPGAFSPIIMDDMVLSDGGLMRNLPIDIARELCADIVIAVWFSTDPPSETDLATPLSLMRRSLGIMIEANQNAQIATLTAADVGIGVEMGDLLTDDFERVPEAIELGRAAAEASRDPLRRYSVSEAEYRAWTASVGQIEPASHVVADVRVIGVERVNPEFVNAQLDEVGPGRTVTAAAIATDAERIYSTGDFERVDYRLTGPVDARVLEIEPIEKSWGPDLLRFDLGLASTGDGEILAILRGDHERGWINELGGRWHNALQLGRQTQLTTDFYQPLNLQQRFFVHSIATLNWNLQDIYIDGDRFARYHVGELYGQVDLGVNFGTRAQARVGVRRGWIQTELDTGFSALPEIDGDVDASVQARFVYDTRDSVGLPTRGSLFNSRWMRSGSLLGGERDYELLELVYAQAFNFRGDSLSLIVGGGERLSGQLPITQEIQLGGIRTFPGLRPQELRGNSYRFAGATYSWLLSDLQPLLGQALYAGVRMQAGRVGAF